MAIAWAGRFAFVAGLPVAAAAAPAPAQTVAAISAGEVRVELDARLRTRIVAVRGPARSRGRAGS